MYINNSILRTIKIWKFVFVYVSNNKKILEYNINDWKSNLKFFRNDIVCFIVDWEEKFAFEETITTKLLLRRGIFQIKRIKLNYSFPNFQIQSHTISKNLSPRFKYISRKILSINLNVKPPSQIASYRRGKRIKKLKKKKCQIQL